MEKGDYVRTHDGIIGKIIDKNMAEVDNRYELDYNNKLYYYTEIAKSSSNIINLIEEGDYVNGKKVAVNCKENKGNMVLFTDMDCANEKEIKSIVTKEQFESMEYKVGE